ncbi:MAG: hypothetical protein AAF763_12380 [Pseudomonadota bacterium]
MTQQHPFGADWWLDGGAPAPRIAAGVLAPALILTVIATLVAFLVYGSALSTGEEVRMRTTTAGLTAVAAFFGFALTLGLLAFLGLWIARKRSVAAFAAAGAAAGLVFGIVATALAGEADLGGAAGFAVTGAAQLLLARWLAKVRGKPPRPESPEA